MNYTKTTNTAGRESGHWYDENGLVAAVPKADGKGMTAPTVRHARKLGLLPSVTSILKVLPKPQLEQWKCRQWAVAARFVERLENETEADWLARVGEQMARMNDHAAIGTDMHAEIARYVAARGFSEEYHPLPEAVEACNWVASLMKEASADGGIRNLKSETSFCSRNHGFGGTVDFYLESANHIWYVDFKTTDDAKISAGDNLAWPDHLMQLQAYERGTYAWGEPGVCKSVHLINLFIGRLGGEVRAHDWTEQDNYFEAQKKAFRVFNSARELWCALNDYDPTSAKN